MQLQLTSEKIFINLFCPVCLSERMQWKSSDLENPSTVHVTAGTRQVTVWLEHRLVQVDHSLCRYIRSEIRK